MYFPSSSPSGSRTISQLPECDKVKRKKKRKFEKVIKRHSYVHHISLDCCQLSGPGLNLSLNEWKCMEKCEKKNTEKFE